MRIAVIASASGNGKTTLGRKLAQGLDVPFVELDALNHGPGWVETPGSELRALLAPTLADEGWVIDGAYRSKLGDLVLELADVVVWLDLPVRIWLPRLVRRTARRLAGREALWNGNRETLRGVVWGRDALIPYAFRMHCHRRRRYPLELSSYPVVRLRTRADVAAFARSVGGRDGHATAVRSHSGSATPTEDPSRELARDLPRAARRSAGR